MPAVSGTISACALAALIAAGIAADDATVGAISFLQKKHFKMMRQKYMLLAMATAVRR